MGSRTLEETVANARTIRIVEQENKYVDARKLLKICVRKQERRKETKETKYSEEEENKETKKIDTKITVTILDDLVTGMQVK